MRTKRQTTSQMRVAKAARKFDRRKRAGRKTFFVDRILSKRIDTDSKTHYLVSWEGHPDRTWEPHSTLYADVPHLVDEFNRRRIAPEEDELESERTPYNGLTAEAPGFPHARLNRPKPVTDDAGVDDDEFIVADDASMSFESGVDPLDDFARSQTLRRRVVQDDDDDDDDDINDVHFGASPSFSVRDIPDELVRVRADITAAHAELEAALGRISACEAHLAAAYDHQRELLSIFQEQTLGGDVPGNPFA